MLKSMSDLGSTYFSLLIPKHVLRPGLVCAEPGSSTEMHYTKILTKAVLLRHPDIQRKETPGGISPLLKLPHYLLSQTLFREKTNSYMAIFF